MDLLILPGEVISIGDMPEEEAQKMADMPYLLLRLKDGREVVLSGLTRNECKACLDSFFKEAQLTLSAA